VAGRVRVHMKGAREFERRLARLAQAAPLVRAAAKALYTEAELVMTEAKKRTPVDTGALRSSGLVEPPLLTGASVEVSFGFGGPAAPYAVVQHERLDYRHTVGQAKFLEQPFNEALPRIRAAMGRVLSTRIARTRG